MTRRRHLSSLDPDALLLPLHQHKKRCTHWAYGLSCKEYDGLLWRSGQRCEVCRVRAEDVQKRPLYVDHDGRLGNGLDHVRGLLCCKCNAQMRFVDTGYRRPTEAQWKYLDGAWFWTGLPEHRRDTPWLPEPQPNPSKSMFRWDNPNRSKRFHAADLAAFRRMGVAS